MKKLILRRIVRTLFVLTSRNRAVSQARHVCDAYMQLAQSLKPGAGTWIVEVPPMPGVDEDMRRWSFYMLLEHNAIVNRTISAIVQQLARNEPLSGAARIDPKKDVMPSPSAGEDQVQAFLNSVEAHLKVLPTLCRLRGTRTTPHPVFGRFDAHKWNCMFSFHMKVHYRQAICIVRDAIPN